jgi:hypothetical protein
MSVEYGSRGLLWMNILVILKLNYLYMYIYIIATNCFPKNVGYAWEYLGTSVDPPMTVMNR